MQTISGNITNLLDQKERDLGYMLTEDEDFLYVHYDGHVIAKFSAVGVSMPTVHEFIKNHHIVQNMEDWQKHQGHD